MFDDQLLDICRKLKPLIGKKADALWIAHATAETPEAKRQTEALIQMLAAKYLSNRVDDLNILLPPPSREDASGEFPLGTVVYGKTELFPLHLRRENFIKHIAISSITGGGKTNVAQILLLGLLERNVPFLVVDWKRSYRALRALNRPNTQKIRVFTVGRKSASPFRWNPLRAPPGVHPKTWISTVAEALEKSHLSGPGVADILIEILDKKFEDTGLYHGIPDKYPNFFDAREELDRVQFKGRRMLWQDSCRHARKFVCLKHKSECCKWHSSYHWWLVS